MPEASLLETTAEVSITLAGFVGVFLALARRDGVFSPSDAFLIRVLVLCCVPPLFYAALPLILGFFDMPLEAVWRNASAVATLAIAAVSFNILATQRAVPSEDRHLLPMSQSIVSYSLATAALLANLSNVLGWPGAPSGALYLTGIWLILAVAGMTFTLLIVRRLL